MYTIVCAFAEESGYAKIYKNGYRKILASLITADQFHVNAEERYVFAILISISVVSRSFVC